MSTILGLLRRPASHPSQTVTVDPQETVRLMTVDEVHDIVARIVGGGATIGSLLLFKPRAPRRADSTHGQTLRRKPRASLTPDMIKILHAAE